MLQGRVETFGTESISGWALDTSRLTDDQFVDIYLDNQHCATVRANLAHKTVNGKACGFKFALVPELKNGRAQGEVSVRFRGTDRDLANTPRRLQFMQTPKRILVLIPAGARYEHDKVRAHEKPLKEMIETYTNTGDFTVYDSSLKLLAYKDVTAVKMKTFTDKDIDFYNSEFDFCFMRGSNFINEHTDWGPLPELLRKLKMPLIPFAIGAQAESRRKLELPEKAKEVWRLFADRCTTMGVRGDYTAEILNDIGIKNVDIIGCPSLFRCNNPDLQIRAKPLAELRKVAFNMRREVSATYAADIKRYLAVQRDFIKRLNRRFDLTVTSHGEPPEKSFFFKDEELIARHMPELIKQGWFESAEDELVKIYRNQMFFSGTVAEHDSFARTMDLVLGFRVHGNLPALANGVPAIFVDYDQRSQELARTFSIPCLTMDQLAKNDLEALYWPDLWQDFNARYRDNYRRMAAFLDRNGMAHRLATV
jgi:Polysaccharide pyruvyl transferase